MRAVVVGASSGLGRCIGVGLGQRGAQVALLARRHDLLLDGGDDLHRRRQQGRRRQLRNEHGLQLRELRVVHGRHVVHAGERVPRRDADLLAGDHLLGNLRREPARGEVVEKEQRLGALHEDVVHAVAYEIVSDGVVDLHRLRDTQFRADAVGR